MRFGADFSALTDRFSLDSKQPVALAVSGGSDSLALLFMCHHWAKMTGRSLIALTVDHGLRPEAKFEAAAVAAHCADIGIQHQTLCWTEPKPTQSAARAARYRLLARAVQDAEASCLLTGHTLDDVIETALIRRRRGIRGPMQAGPALAAPLPSWPDGRGIALLRPLVRVRRTALRTFLKVRDIEWVDDPSNDNPSFERVRVRKFLARHETLAEMASHAVMTLQAERARADAALGEDLAKIAVRADGLIETLSPALSPRLAGLLARCASGSDRDPRGGAMGHMLANLTTAGSRQTLGGAWFQRTQSGFAIGRDPATGHRQFDRTLFDGRYVRDPRAKLPDQNDASFLVRHALPGDRAWREIISERLAHLRHCYLTPFYDCISV